MSPRNLLPCRRPKVEKVVKPEFAEVTNAEFVAAIFRDVPDGAQVAVCSKAGDPSQGGWHAQAAGDVDNQCPPGNNNYVNCSSFYPTADEGTKGSQGQLCRFPCSDAGRYWHQIPVENVWGIQLDMA